MLVDARVNDVSCVSVRSPCVRLVSVFACVFVCVGTGELGSGLGGERQMDEGLDSGELSCRV